MKRIQNILTFAWLLLASCQAFQHDGLTRRPTKQQLLVAPFRASWPRQMSLQEDDDTTSAKTSAATTTTLPTDRPLLALVDAVALLGFAAVGKASHSPDGSLDLAAVAVTAFPFVLSWLVTSPLTGVYNESNTRNRASDSNLIVDTVKQTATGWIFAIPLGCVLRGLIKGYVPPLSFVVVTMIATLVLLGVARVLFSVAEDFFVEFV